MVAWLSLAAAAAASLSATGGRAFVAPRAAAAPPRASRRGVQLEGRDVEGALVPTNNFLLVKVAAVQDATDGGILLTGTAKITKTEGTVVAAGPGRTHQESGLLFPMPVVAGEGVVYGKYDGTELEYDGAKHTLIRDSDVLVKFSGAAPALDTVDVISDNVLVKVEAAEEATASGLLIAATSQKDDKPSTGEVVKVGPGRMASNGEIMTVDINTGDMVKFRDFAGTEVNIEGEEYAVVRMTDILAKF